MVFGIKGKTVTYQPAQIYIKLRDKVFARGDGRAEEVWGVLMELGLAKAVATVVALADGAVSLYLSNGGGFIGMGPHEGPRRAADALLKAAPEFMRYCEATSEYPLPREGHTRFYLLSQSGVFTAEVKDEELACGRHPLSPLYRHGHELMAAVRSVDSRRRIKPSVH